MDFRSVKIHSTGCRPDNHEAVAHMEGRGFDEKFRHTEFGEIFNPLTDIDLLLRSDRTVAFGPFAHLLSLVITIPKSAVEHSGKTLVPIFHLLRSESAFLHGLHRFLVAPHHGVNIFGRACTTFNLKDRNTGFHHSVDETDGFEVFGAHDVFVVHFQFSAGFLVRHHIFSAALLHAGPTIGRRPLVVEREVAFATHRHAERAMTEHFDANLFARRAADVFAVDKVGNVAHLLKIEFACQHDHIGKVGVKAQRLLVGDVELCGEMDFLPDAVAIAQHRHIGGDNG